MSNYSRLNSGAGAFDSMMNKFGVVTVMNAKVYDIAADIDWYQYASDLVQAYLAKTPLCTLDTLKVANVTIDGPTKTVTGGQYSNALIKFGKTARLEMQDALGNAEAIEFLCGGVVEYVSENGAKVALHNGSDFASPKVIIGDSFFIDQATGKQVKVNIAFWQFNPDSIFNLTQDAEGDATVFDMNGDLLTTEIKIGGQTADVKHGVFYSIVEAQTGAPMSASASAEDTTITITNLPAGATAKISLDGGLTWTANESLSLTAGVTARVRAIKNGNVVASCECIITE